MHGQTCISEGWGACVIFHNQGGHGSLKEGGGGGGAIPYSWFFFLEGCIFRELNLKRFFTNSISRMIYLDCCAGNSSSHKFWGFKYTFIHSRNSRNMHPSKKNPATFTV